MFKKAPLINSEAFLMQYLQFTNTFLPVPACGAAGGQI